MLNCFFNHASNDAENQNLWAFSNILSLYDNDVTNYGNWLKKLIQLFLAADANNYIMILHSPKNFGGTHTQPKNKAVCMLGMGTQVVSVLVDLNLALANCNIIAPTVNKLSGCATAQEVEDILILAANGLVGFKGSAIFIPGPVLQNVINTSNTNDPFDLIPLMNSRARDFEAEVVDILAEVNWNPVNHADNLNAWLYGIRQGTIPKTRYSFLPKDNKIAHFNAQQHQACISQGGVQQNAGIL